jgi:hypothetical protein
VSPSQRTLLTSVCSSNRLWNISCWKFIPILSGEVRRVEGGVDGAVEGGVLGVGWKPHSHFLGNCNSGNVRKPQCLPTVVHSVRDKHATQTSRRVLQYPPQQNAYLLFIIFPSSSSSFHFQNHLASLTIYAIPLTPEGAAAPRPQRQRIFAYPASKQSTNLTTSRRWQRVRYHLNMSKFSDHLSSETLRIWKSNITCWFRYRPSDWVLSTHGCEVRIIVKFAT